MNDLIDLVRNDGIWLFVAGLLTSILLGFIKTYTKSKLVSENELTEEEKKKRDNLFDIVCFISGYILSLIASMVCYPIINGSFSFLGVLVLSMSVWTAQQLIFGIWKKLGLKRFLIMVANMVIRDQNGDGKIDFTDAILQVKKAFRGGKFNVGDFTDEASKGLEEGLEKMNEEMGEELGDIKAPDVKLFSNTSSANSIPVQEVPEYGYQNEQIPTQNPTIYSSGDEEVKIIKGVKRIDY